MNAVDASKEHMDELAYGPVVRRAFRRYGLPAEWGMAIAKIESGFDPTAYKDTGGDAARGGAWGICQMTLETAHGLGYMGDGEGLYDPEVCAGLAARLCEQNRRRFGPGLLDIAAAYNGGASFKHASTGAKHYAVMVAHAAAYYAGKFANDPV